PASGQAFLNWVVSTNWTDGVTNSNATLTFTMQSNLTVTANFIPNPFLRAKGFYNGLFAETERAQERSGFFRLTVGEFGGYSGSLQRGTNVYALSGRFNVLGQTSQTVAAGGANFGTLTMALDFAGAAEQLTGTIGNGQWSADLLANRAVFNATTNPATQYMGRYTLIIPGSADASASPGGDGYGTVIVGPAGYVTLSGSLADGNALSQLVPLSRNGYWPFYMSRYAGKGSVWGWLMFDANQPSAQINGWVSWIKTAVPVAQFYSAGFTNLAQVVGSRYTAPTTNRVIDLTNGAVIFEGGNLSGPFTNLVALSDASKITDLSLSNKLNLTVAVSNGTFFGSVRVPGTMRTNIFKGALLQDLGVGYGYFLGTNQSGGVFLGP